MALKPAVRTYKQVMAFMNAQVKHNTIVHDFGRCLQTSWTGYGVPAAGAPNASKAWAMSKQKHTDGTTPPAGAHVLWTGGSKGFGHSAISAGDGKVYSVDIGGSPRVYLTTIDAINKAWGGGARGLDYRGWTTDYCGKSQLDVKGYDSKGRKIKIGGTATVKVSKLNGRSAPTTGTVIAVRARGYKITYTDVVSHGGRKWLKTFWGTYYAADLTTFGG